MEIPDFSSARSPRRELQGPRPTPLRVRKDSHKIRKPPVVPGNPAHHPSSSHAPPRPPVIIYTVSPKIIHANPNEFMSLVQRLTGPGSSAASTSSSSPFHDSSGAVSPAARFASIEKTRSPEGRKPQVFEEMETDHVQRSNQFPGILSPNPNALPPIPPSFFSPPSDQNPLNFFHDLSPVMHSNRNNYFDGGFMLPSPSPFISPHIMNTPSPNTLDLFHSLFDL